LTYDFRNFRARICVELDCVVLTCAVLSWMAQR